MGAWRSARASAPDMTEDEARLALEQLDPLGEAAWCRPVLDAGALAKAQHPPMARMDDDWLTFGRIDQRLVFYASHRPCCLA